MAKNTNASTLLALNDRTNLQMKVKKSTGVRRRVGSIEDVAANLLEQAETPAQMAELAINNHIRLEEVMGHADRAPNFGQFRMVLGNRIRSVIKRKTANPELPPLAWTYPDEYRREKARDAKAAREMAKADAKVAKAKAPKEPAPAPAKVTKKVAKKTGRKAKPPVKVEIEDAPDTI